MKNARQFATGHFHLEQFGLLTSRFAPADWPFHTLVQLANAIKRERRVLNIALAKLKPVKLSEHRFIVLDEAGNKNHRYALFVDLAELIDAKIGGRTDLDIEFGEHFYGAPLWSACTFRRC